MSGLTGVSLDLVLVLATTLAVFFFAMVVVGILRRAYAQYEDQYLAKKITDLSEMFFFIGPRQLIVLTVAVTLIAAALGLMLLGPVATVILMVSGLAFPTVLVRFYRARRVKLFERQMVDALVGIASAFRAGLTLQQAPEEIAKTANPPLSQELSLTVREMALGKSTEEALESLAKRVESDDLLLVVTAINTARTVGGNMAGMLDTLSDTIRERFRIEGRIRALTAQGRLQGLIIGAMPFLIWIAFDAIRPDLTRPMMRHWFGYAIIGAVIVMEAIGAFFIRRVIAIRV
ncbi:MAG: type II secretion system F family protein [Deltaproteobacteria bacterium]|nr:type II secretion system F family protein [Deltaproteobacteria bacterium]